MRPSRPNSTRARWWQTPPAAATASSSPGCTRPSSSWPARFDGSRRARRHGRASTCRRRLEWVEGKLDLALAERQREAVRLAVSSKTLVITGGPGVGKTTIVRAILAILGAKRVKVLLCAPTGRAAKRLAEVTGLEAKTIHRLLEVESRRRPLPPRAANPLDCDLLVVDETSMVDVPLMHALVRAVPRGPRLIFVGDVDQLPSVGPGQVLDDIIGSGAVPVVRLTEVFRQAAASRIVVNAHRVNRGEMPELQASPDSLGLLLRRDRRARRKGWARSSRSWPSAFPSDSGSTPFATSRS